MIEVELAADDLLVFYAPKEDLDALRLALPCAAFDDRPELEDHYLGFVIAKDFLDAPPADKG
jgi:hypothetical protein